ncbi:REP-associated tyrosine transposase [Nitrosomonas ureae]|uniref:Putative transposase n=1 Tax=Nitrosomonas ureae TaxID=44577 RepID=A0A1H9D023_9PROT|nr:transposase [Nitrosomonas ureae]SEQ06741.1 putative transposase [Nitrosomonas ureae]
MPDGTYFFTVNLLERRLDLLVRHIDHLREAVRVIKQVRPFHIDAWVVLPDQMHCIWTLPEDDADYAARWRLIKLLFAKGLPKQERLATVRRVPFEFGLPPLLEAGNSRRTRSISRLA